MSKDFKFAHGNCCAVGTPTLHFTCGICGKYYKIQEGNEFVYEITKQGLFGGEKILFCNTCANTLRNLILKEQSSSHTGNKKKRKYIRKCGVCGIRFEQSEMIRTEASPNGWMCYDCEQQEF
jgi:hypothetical protein